MSSVDAARIRAFERGSVARVAEEVKEIPQGWVARAPSLPWVWDINHVGVTGAIRYPEAAELLERHQAELPYRHLVVEHEPSGERLEEQLRREGWKVWRNVGMALRREPERGLDTSGVIEAGEDEALELMGDWISDEDTLRVGSDAHRQVLEATRLTWRARSARRFGVIGADGALAGITMLFSDGVVAQVEDVYVVPDERGRGFGRALVTHAARFAQELGHELVFIAGDDEDWPKELYAQVGFETVARTWVFHR